METAIKMDDLGVPLFRKPRFLFIEPKKNLEFEKPKMNIMGAYRGFLSKHQEYRWMKTPQKPKAVDVRSSTEFDQILPKIETKQKSWQVEKFREAPSQNDLNFKTQFLHKLLFLIKYLTV